MAGRRKVCLAHLSVHMHLLFCDLCAIWRAMGVLYAWYCWLVWGGVGRDLHIDQVSFSDNFVYRAGNAPMIFWFHCEKAINDTTDLRISFFE